MFSGDKVLAAGGTLALEEGFYWADTSTHLWSLSEPGETVLPEPSLVSCFLIHQLLPDSYCLWKVLDPSGNRESSHGVGLSIICASR